MRRTTTSAPSARGREHVDDAGGVRVRGYEAELHVVARRAVDEDVTIPERERAARENDTDALLRHRLTCRGDMGNGRDRDATTELVGDRGDELRVEAYGECDR